MKIWLDDIRPAPEGYVWCKSVNIAKRTIESAEEPIVLIDCDHDLGLFKYFLISRAIPDLNFPSMYPLFASSFG